MRAAIIGMVAAATMALGVAAGTGLAPAAQASASQSAAIRTYAIGTSPSGHRTVAYRPYRQFWIYNGGPDLYAEYMHWSKWTHRSATGRARLIGLDFDRFSLGTGILHFSRAVYSAGRWHFTRLHIDCTSRTCRKVLGARYFRYKHGTWLP